MQTEPSCAIVPSPDLLAHAQREAGLADELASPTSEKRSQVRLPLAFGAVVKTVDRELTPLGDAFAAVTRDMTADGLGLILEGPLSEGAMVAVQLNIGAQELFLLGESLWCQPSGPYYSAGVRIVVKLKSMP